MDIIKVYAIYFSPTGTTERAVVAAAKGTGLPGARIDLTSWKNRANYSRAFNQNEIVVVGLPVYGGRLPGKIDDFFSCLQGQHTPAVAVVAYGNQAYGDGLAELKARLEERGFKVIAGAAFIGEYTFSKNVGTGRPDANDLAIAREFGKAAAAGAGRGMAGTLKVKGDYPSALPVMEAGNPQSHYTGWAQVGTSSDCSFCGLCEEMCPWHAINIGDNVVTNYAKCMRCFRCIRICPSKARKVIDPSFPKFVERLEKTVEQKVNEPELFFCD